MGLVGGFYVKTRGVAEIVFSVTLVAVGFFLVLLMAPKISSFVATVMGAKDAYAEVSTDASGSGTDGDGGGCDGSCDGCDGGGGGCGP
jgi:hypothetical protein